MWGLRLLVALLGVLLFVALRPWLLCGVSALVWAVAAIVRAIQAPGRRPPGSRRRS